MSDSNPGLLQQGKSLWPWNVLSTTTGKLSFHLWCPSIVQRKSLLMEKQPVSGLGKCLFFFFLAIQGGLLKVYLAKEVGEFEGLNTLTLQFISNIRQVR